MNQPLTIADVMRVFDKLISHWQLTPTEQAWILGMTLPHYEQLTGEKQNTASPELMDRLVRLVGIQKAVSVIAPKGAENQFFTATVDSPPLQGRSIRDYLITQNSEEDLEALFRWINSKAC